MTFFKLLILSTKRKNLSSISIFLSINILNIFLQNDNSKSFIFRFFVRTLSKRQIRRILPFKKHQSNYTNKNHLRKLHRQKKNQKNSTNKQQSKTKQVEKIISNETNQKTERSYSKIAYQINAIMILIINKTYAQKNVFDVLTAKDITAAKTCCRFMSAFNREKMISTKWNFFKSQTIKFVKQSKKRFNI